MLLNLNDLPQNRANHIHVSHVDRVQQHTIVCPGWNAFSAEDTVTLKKVRQIYTGAIET